MTILFHTRDGHRFDLENFELSKICIDEIANALSNQGRYNGQTKQYYSVAQHCVLLARYAKKMKMPLKDQKWLLLHDASEAYVGDIVYHLKNKLSFFKELEDKALRDIFWAFEVNFNCPEGVLKLDRLICIDEMTQLMSLVDPMLDPKQALGIKIEKWSPAKAKKEYLKEVKRLKLKNKFRKVKNENFLTKWATQIWQGHSSGTVNGPLQGR